MGADHVTRKVLDTSMPADPQKSHVARSYAHPTPFLLVLPFCPSDRLYNTAATIKNKDPAYVGRVLIHTKLLRILVIVPTMIPPITVVPARMDVIHVSGRTPVVTRWVVTVSVRVVSGTVVIARSIARSIEDGTRNSDVDVDPRLRLVWR
jgi:hypothetical protein